MSNSSDPNAASRKKDHIKLALESRVDAAQIDRRFDYEPALSGHNVSQDAFSLDFAGKKMEYPIWVSSMTGGTELAKTINENLARVCGEFGLGMGLGSCRSLLESDERLQDFDVRHLIGDQYPLYANLGIAQIETLIRNGKVDLIGEMIEKLKADGMIIHINPLQEWLQPEGDTIQDAPAVTIEKLLEILPGRYIVKEVGQGMGKRSLRALLGMPLTAIEFGAHGGTNFSTIELKRNAKKQQDVYRSIAHVGHDATEMMQMVNELTVEMGDNIDCKQVIVSGGVKDFLDGYYLTQKLNLASVYGQAGPFLKHARDDYESLREFVQGQIDGLKLAKAFLHVK